ncbi:hypothetical protein AQUCO_00400799v1 [Aquilegia coerulea]|uniref:EF-hand domain-containing protein n=1 Tax=Aquilegia coerulea TaxID=218851 RepID=A0A2G5EWP6_AQUCA|nr:hypothetical protein AQUCO_00400799v1 [Aquilegia coerulea]
MGQTMHTLATGRTEEKKANEIGTIIEQYYDTYFPDPDKVCTMADFYRAICQTVEEINKKIGGTQLRVPSKEILEKAYKKHRHEDKDKALTKEEFRKILKDVMFDTGLLGTGAKDIIFFIFGAPMTALLIKQKLAPKAIPNAILIPGVTSATVFVLARLNKI